MTAALLLGAGFGLALLAAQRLLWPPPPPLPVALARLSATRPAAPQVQAAGVRARLGGRLRSTAAALGVRLDVREADLAITGRDRDAHLGGRALAALGGGLAPAALFGLAAIAGLDVPAAGTALAALAGGAAGFALPEARLRSAAAARRRGFVTALGCFCDLVVISLAGGAGVEAALHEGSQTGSGRPFARLRRVLETARLSGEPPWAGLGRLGTRLGVPVLGELAASIALAGVEGARVRASLAAKATAIRDRQLAEAEAAAQSATERLAIPTVLMLTGFLILIGYPAVVHILSGL